MKRALAILTAAAVLPLVCPTAQGGVGMGIIKEDPRVTHEKWKREAERDYKAGIKARAAGNKADAVKYLMQAFRIGRRMRIHSPYPQKAADALEELAREGLRELDVARDMVAGDAPRAGLLELKRITRTYLGLPPARLAGRLQRQLTDDPAFQARLRQARLADQLARAEALETQAATLAAADHDNDAEGGSEPAADLSGVAQRAKPEAAGLPDPSRQSPLPPEPTPPEAEAANPEAVNETPTGGECPDASASGSSGKEPAKPLPEGVEDAEVRKRPLTPAERAGRRLELLAEAHAIYARLAETGKGTEVGQRADAARKRLEKDAELLKRIRRTQAEDQAREWLDLGTNYMRAGHMDKAREYFKKVLDECPDTPQAREARGYLDGMSE